MSENVEITVADRLGYLVNDLNRCRQAITYRGGTVAAKEGLMDIPDSIANIPLSSSIGTVTDDTLDSIKLIPSNSVPACYIKSIGGMTYKCENLMPFPYIVSSGAYQGIEMGIGASQNFSEDDVTVNADRSITISRRNFATGDTITLSVSVPSADYYLTVFKVSSEGDDHISISSNVGSIPFGESVFIPSSTGITQITLSDIGGEAFSCTLNIILSKYPYFEGLKDTKTTAVKVHGSNLITFPYYSKSNTTNGITSTVNDDGRITVNGTATAQVAFVILAAPIKISNKQQYTISGNCISNNWPDGVFIVGTTKLNGATGQSSPVYNYLTSRILNWGDVISDVRLVIPSGTVCNNVTFQPMINIGTTALPYAPYHEPITYEIPETLQGTGKGVEGAADTTDYENKKYITRCKTIELGDVTGYALESVGGSVNKYITDDGIVAVMSYSVNDFNHSLRTKALCSHLPTHTDWTGKTYGVVLQNMASGSHYIKVCIMAADAGVTTDDDYSTIVSKIITWLIDNNVILTYALAEPTEESIDTSIFNNIPNVEAGGYLEFVTDNGFAPNSSVLFQTIP